MKTFAFLLILAVFLFVAMVIVPQVQQIQQVQQVQPSDLVGMWAPDGENAWEIARKRPLVAKKLAGLQPDAIARLKAWFLTEVTARSCQFTNDKIIMSGPGGRREDNYKISSLDGNVFTVDCTDDKGKTSQIKVTVTHDRLDLFDPNKPDMVLVFKRAP